MGRSVRQLSFVQPPVDHFIPGGLLCFPSRRRMLWQARSVGRDLLYSTARQELAPLLQTYSWMVDTTHWKKSRSRSLRGVDRIQPQCAVASERERNHLYSCLREEAKPRKLVLPALC